nr:hypothetical protein [uncultured Flavobacterium sp.]
MKNVKTTFAIFISVFYSTINAQEKKESQEAFATFEINDARYNGDDITQEVFEENDKLVLYKSTDGKEIMFSNYWEKSKSQSYGRIYSIYKEEFPESEKELKHGLYEFQWSYTNTYDDKKGTAKIRLFVVYKPQGIYFECTVLPENLDELVYKGTMKGDLSLLVNSIKK